MVYQGDLLTHLVERLVMINTHFARPASFTLTPEKKEEAVTCTNLNHSLEGFDVALIVAFIPWGPSVDYSSVSVSFVQKYLRRQMRPAFIDEDPLKTLRNVETLGN